MVTGMPSDMPAEWLAMAALAVLGSVGTFVAMVWRRWQGTSLVRQAEAGPVTWAGADVAWIVAMALVLQTLAVSLGPQPPPLERQLVAGMLATACAAAIAALYLRRRGASWATLGFHVADWPAALRQALGTVLLVVAPLLGLAAFLDRIVPYRHPLVEFLAEHRDAASLAIVWLAATVTAPIVEEFFFRRILQGWLETRLTGMVGAARAGGLAIAGASLAFALAHLGQGLAWVPLTALGIVLGILARQTGSIVPGILAHALFNAVSVVLVLMQPAP